VSKRENTRYTLLFATAVCVVCALLVSVAAVALQPRQAAAARLYMEKNVLLAAGLLEPGARVTEQDVNRIFDQRIRVRLVDLATGELVPAEKADARGFDQRRARGDPNLSRAAPANNAGIGRLPNQGVVYFILKEGADAKDRAAAVDQIVIPIEGLAMWGTAYGFLSLDRDTNTIRGLTFYDQKETPGLGGEIGNPRWQALWHGRQAFDAKWNPRIAVIKGQAGPPEADPLRVDGLSGATITSNAVTRLVQFWLSDNGYGKFLRRFRDGVDA
jgi:Na+-transporting NADH:ubiquinone oxidoreductase subunit C